MDVVVRWKMIFGAAVHFSDGKVFNVRDNIIDTGVEWIKHLLHSPEKFDPR